MTDCVKIAKKHFEMVLCQVGNVVVVFAFNEAS